MNVFPRSCDIFHYDLLHEESFQNKSIGIVWRGVKYLLSIVHLLGELFSKDQFRHFSAMLHPFQLEKLIS